jgi:uncharacterized protein YbaR (Trm112 family)
MDAIEFACVFEEITKSLKIELDSDIAGNIFDMYENTYENYTLLELIGLLREGNHEITCPWNKNALIKMIKEKKIDIPEKKEHMQPTVWKHYRIRRSLDVIDTKYLEFYEGSIIQDPSGQIYMLEDIIEELLPEDDAEESYDDDDDDDEDDDNDDDDDNERTVVIMYFKNMDTYEELSMHAEDFMWRIDNEDVTILQDRNCVKFMNEEQEQYWTNYIRWM